VYTVPVLVQQQAFRQPCSLCFALRSTINTTLTLPPQYPVTITEGISYLPLETNVTCDKVIALWKILPPPLLHRVSSGAGTSVAWHACEARFAVVEEPLAPSPAPSGSLGSGKGGKGGGKKVGEPDNCCTVVMHLSCFCTKPLTLDRAVSCTASELQETRNISALEHFCRLPGH
jgi:hypothetical protein